MGGRPHRAIFEDRNEGDGEVSEPCKWIRVED